ncbi:MAG: ribonuclease III [Chloroflexi bacterium]|nr:ribonuclease III [Chloroflexota bacterium]
MNTLPDGEALESPAELAKRLGLPFSNLLLLTRALTHRSYVNERPEALEDNERLEFLGDAVLDFAVGAWLFNHYPELAEGPLTRMRSALVRTDQLAEFARQLDLGRAMRLGRGESQAGGRDRAVLLCDTFESLIGALYLQTDIEYVMHYLLPLLENASTLVELQPDLHDAKSRLQEWSQSRGLGIPHYETVCASGPDHDRLFQVEVRIDGESKGRGSGHSKQIAAQLAAQNALNLLEKS